MNKYGIEFPEELSEGSIELHCYRWGCGDRVRGYIAIPDHEQWEHLYNAITLLWPERYADGRKGYIVHPWTIPRIKAWCEIGKDGPWDIWWGPSSVAKTTDAAVILLSHWWSAPDLTTCHVISTKIEALKLRLFGELARFHGLVPGAPGEVKMSVPCITLGDENSKNIIMGHGIWKGNVDTAMNNLVGIHNEFNAMVIDEMQGSLPAAPAAAENLSSGREFKALGIGNPQRRLDVMGRYSEPIGGWENCNDRMEKWKTKFGWVHFWDGLKSPGIKEPEKYFFLLNQRMIDDTERIFSGRNNPQFWSQRRGFIPPEGLTPVVMSESFISQNHMRDSAVWETGFQMAAGFDPAYSAGGDRAVVYPIKFGTMVGGKFGLEYQTPIALELGGKGEKLMSEHIADQLMGVCKPLGITPENIAMDCTGMQGALADYIEKTWARGILRVQFGGKPSTRRMEDGNSDTCDKRYRNRVTELWYAMNYFGRHGHIRGLSDKSCQEFSTRELDEIGTPMKIEGKDSMKARTGESPDESDAAVCALEWVIARQYILPGGTEVTPEAQAEEDKLYREYDVDGDVGLYLESRA